MLTRTAHLLTRVFLAIPDDSTGAFRAYRLDRSPANILSVVRSKTYPFFFESLLVLHLNGAKIIQIPIDLPPRTYGSSKMRSAEPFRGVWHLIKVAVTRMICRETFLSADRLIDPTPPCEMNKVGMWYLEQRGHRKPNLFDPGNNLPKADYRSSS